MEKVIRNGKVAVLYSPSYGAGWFTWNGDYPQILFHPLLVKMVEEGRSGEITQEFCQEHLGIDLYCGGAADLQIDWLPIGTAFRIEEYDGCESIFIPTGESFICA